MYVGHHNSVYNLHGDHVPLLLCEGVGAVGGVGAGHQLEALLGGRPRPALEPGHGQLVRHAAPPRPLQVAEEGVEEAEVAEAALLQLGVPVLGRVAGGGGGVSPVPADGGDTHQHRVDGHRAGRS